MSQKKPSVEDKQLKVKRYRIYYYKYTLISKDSQQTKLC